MGPGLWRRARRGFTLIELMIVIGIIAIVAAISIPNLLEARKGANETAAITALKGIGSAEALFRDRDLDGDGVMAYATLRQLAARAVVDEVLGSGTKQGYLFQATFSAATPDYLWYAVANPSLPGAGLGTTGARYFVTNTPGAVFYTTSAALALDNGLCRVPPGVIDIR